MLTILRSVPTRSIDHLTPYVDLIFVDRSMSGCQSFIDQLRFMASLKDDILFLEDDIRIDTVKVSFIKDTIHNYPDMLINFSSRRIIDGIVPPSTFQFTQCVYFPKRILSKILSNLDVDRFLRFSHYDVALREILNEDYLSVYYEKAMTDLKLQSVMKYY